MAKQKSRFPSYGLVRGPSHERGGVAGMVAGEQPVELEGGEWIIPKEAVPDYLPVLKQITNEGRAMQQMQNGNSAMDALIASASMETGLAQPKSPMFMGGGMMDEYEGGGQLHSRRMYNQKDKKKYGYEMGGMMPEYQDGGEIPIRRKNQPMGESDKKIGEILSALLKYNPVNMTAKTLQYAKDEDLLGQMMGNYPPSIKEQTAFDQRNKEIKERWGNPTLPGQMQPRKQQEIRNPQMYGPPDSLMGPDTTMGNLDDLLNYYMESDRRNKLNALTGDSIDFEADSLNLLKNMDKSKIPRARRKIMQQGGKIDYDVIGLESLENRFPNFDAPMSNPEFEAAMQYGERGMDSPQGSPEGSFMSSLKQDKRVRPNDSYIVENGFMSKKEVPKRSSAYMQSMGIETPLSRRQRSLLQRKAIAPETLNPQVQSLLGRALVQRLANEPL